jgi:hypothetical protein
MLLRDSGLLFRRLQDVLLSACRTEFIPKRLSEGDLGEGRQVPAAESVIAMPTTATLAVRMETVPMATVRMETAATGAS